MLAALPVFSVQPAHADRGRRLRRQLHRDRLPGRRGFQWTFNGSPILRGIPRARPGPWPWGPVTPLNAGTYAVIATGAGGSKTSTAAVLNVTAAAGTPTLPIIPSGVFTITAFGAVGDGATDNTAAIQATIAAALAAGGGTVEVPAAAHAFLSGPLTFGSAISLQVDAGATLQALPFGTYPNASNNPAVFIPFKNSSNVQIVGGGTIDGNGAAWWAAFNASSTTARPDLIKLSKLHQRPRGRRHPVRTRRSSTWCPPAPT